MEAPCLAGTAVLNPLIFLPHNQSSVGPDGFVCFFPVYPLLSISVLSS